MSLLAKFSIAVVIALIASSLTTYSTTGKPFDPFLLLAFAAATLITVLATHRNRAAAGTTVEDSSEERHSGHGEPSGERETGTVKWFNGTKGFGFIIRDNGEEIFVHFRSIRGEGRRGLRDGQAVSYVVAQSDKGPQAEDVEPL